MDSLLHPAPSPDKTAPVLGKPEPFPDGSEPFILAEKMLFHKIPKPNLRLFNETSRDIAVFDCQHQQDKIEDKNSNANLNYELTLKSNWNRNIPHLVLPQLNKFDLSKLKSKKKDFLYDDLEIDYSYRNGSKKIDSKNTFTEYKPLINEDNEVDGYDKDPYRYQYPGTLQRDYYEIYYKNNKLKNEFLNIQKTASSIMSKRLIDNQRGSTHFNKVRGGCKQVRRFNNRSHRSLETAAAKAMKTEIEKEEWESQNSELIKARNCLYLSSIQKGYRNSTHHW